VGKAAERHGSRRVAEQALDADNIHTTTEEQGSTGMPKIMESGGARETGTFEERLEVIVADARRAQEAAAAGREDEVSILPDQSRDAFGVLARAMAL
jgi:hypothetical protein